MKTIAAHATNYTSGRTRAIDHIIIHYTGNNGDTAEGNGKYFSAASREASAHYFVDEKEVLQSVRDGDTAWHAGNWVMNCRSLGVEMCSKKDANGKYYIPDATVKNAQEIVRQLMAKYNIPVSHVLRHYDVTKKQCPEPFVRDPAQWTRFKEGLTVPKTTGTPPSAWAKDACDWCVANGIVKGDDKGDCKWHDTIDKQTMATMMKRLYDLIVKA